MKRIFWAAVCLGGLLLGACQVAPEDELEAAQKQIDAARKAEADLYAPELLRSAEDLLSEASMKISEKSYQEARDLANQAREKAEKAEKIASEKQSLEKEERAKFLSETEQQIANLKTRIDALPEEAAGARSRLSLKLSEAQHSLLIYKGRIEARRFGEARAMEAPVREKLQTLSDGIDLVLQPGSISEKREKKEKEGAKRQKQ